VKKINFVFGIHNHQPIGNFDFVFEDAFQKSYLPFIDVLERHPKIRIAIHFTGILLEWLIKNHPDYIPRVKKMVDLGQLEILTGGFYEPILAVINENDRNGQIKKLTSAVNKYFGYEAEGMWLAERIWEPTLPTSLYNANIKYTVLDDTHFKYAGLREEDLTGYYLTEDLGHTVKLFPISKKLRYSIPFQDPSITIDYLKEMASENGVNTVVFADDGEKFGVWPNTYDHVYTNGWLENFFSALEENMEWINMMHFKEAANHIKPKGNIYLPTASYAEMGEWALFAKAQQEFTEFEHTLMDQNQYDQNNVFIRGGFWRNFLAKYREVNDMHKKMLRLSKQLWAAPEEDRTKLSSAFDKLWAAQCNCPYWHGVFGGIYLSHIRDAIYTNLIAAEKEIEKYTLLKLPQIIVEDVNYDGYDEVILESEKVNLYFDLLNGGTIYGFDYKPLNKNLADTMTRRMEAYHSKLAEAVSPEKANGTASIHDLVLAKEPGLMSKLHYDFYDRKMLIDHFVDSDLNLRNFAAATYQEKGDFLNAPFIVTQNVVSGESAEITLERTASAFGRTLKLQKNITVVDERVSIVIHIDNISGEPVQFKYGVEFNFGLQAGHADDRYYYLKDQSLANKFLDSTGITNNDFIGLKDEWRGLDIGLSYRDSGEVWRFPIETISLSEGGFERVYQSSALVGWWSVNLNKSWRGEIELTLGNKSK
jgi:alpha-amylase